jgi:hypothetical protein
MRSTGPARVHKLAALLFFPFLAFCSEGAPAKPWPGGVEQTVAAGLKACDVAGSPVSNAKLNACLGLGAQQPQCLDEIFKLYMVDHSTTQALALLQCYEDNDTNLNVSCHPISHAIGRNTYVIDKTIDKAFSDCNQTCHSGCYHGVMERFLRGDSDSDVHLSFPELKAKAATACPDTLDSLHRFQCLHGLGHAVLYYSNYDLEGSLAISDGLGSPWAMSSCNGGIFMENLVAADKEKRDVSPTDVHYPCSKLDDKYKNDCYGMQTSRMAEMGLSNDRILEECRKTNGYEDSCTQSLGRDASDTVRGGDPKAVSKLCESGIGTQMEWCTRGVIYALIDNTWDGKYAYPFCATYDNADNAKFCYETSTDYLKGVFSKSKDDLEGECRTFANGNAICLAAVDR